VTAPVHVFVARTGNGFMRDIAEWVAEAAVVAGWKATVVDDRLPEADGTINLVVAPHEFFELFDASPRRLQRAAAASVCICTEQPDTSWFHLSLDACRRGLLSLDINEHGLAELRAAGVTAERLPLGAVPSMTARAGEAAETARARPIDVLFMGGLDQRRSRILADLAPRLTSHRCELRLFRFERPVTASTPGLVFGADKFELLSRSRVLLNLHRERSGRMPDGSAPPPYFEWARMIEACANGCVVLTEPSYGHQPLEAGTHFVEAAITEIGDVLDELLADESRITALRTAARDAVTGPLWLPHSISPLLRRIESDVVPLLPDHVENSAPTRGLWRLGASKIPPAERLGAFRPYQALQSTAKRLALEESRSLRRLDSAACVLRHGSTQHIERTATRAYEGARADVSVVVTLYNYADVVVATLESLLASSDIGFEIVIVEDRSTDASRDVVRAFMDAHPDVPMLLVAKEVNEGLAAARNTGFEHARAPLVMVVDADNFVTRRCLRTLADALCADSAADAAYGILEEFGGESGLRSALAWDPEQLCRANYIDAQAMIRREAWERLGGYRDDDDHVFGWEDWDLWLRIAASGGHAAFVPEILGRYRVQRGSMIALTNLATDEALDALELRYPTLPWPESRPG